MKRFLVLACALVLLPLCALAVTSVPPQVDTVGEEAFAGTAIDALIVPSTVENLGANVLSGTGASYLLLNGAGTALSAGAENGVAYVFGPADSPANTLANFYPVNKLVSDSGLYYFVDGTARPLCAQNPGALSGTITIPKLLNGVPVATAEGLYLKNTRLSQVRIPEYLGTVEGVSCVPYQTLFLTEPVPDVTEIAGGNYINWTTSVEGAWGDVLYTWTFTVGEQQFTATTTEPAVRFAPRAEGLCTVTVTAVDELGDTATIQGGEVTLTEMTVVRRALLIGNTYPGTSSALAGPDRDVFAMTAMLNGVKGANFRITSAQNLTASGMQAAIASAFADATPADVSLFYFSGHGSTGGALVGVNSTSLPVNTLRSALDKIPGLKIVVLDSCYSGGTIGRSAASPSSFNRSVISAFKKTTSRSSVNLEDQGYIVLTSCSQDQVSITLNDGSVSFGAFTYGLCYGSGYDEWNGNSLGYLPADSNGDGAITLGEAYKGVQERIAYLRGMTALEQETQYYGDTSTVLWFK